MKNLSKSYLFCTFTRSLDNYHKENNKVHLVASVFYTQYIELENLINLKNRLNIIMLFENKSKISELNFKSYINNDLVFNKIDINYFLGLGYTDNFNSINNKSLKQNPSFIQYLLDNGNTEKENEKDKNLINLRDNCKFNNILFIVEEIDWFTLQLYFKLANIVISGGTISKRQILSTTQYNLFKYLMLFNFNEEDIFNSYKFLGKLNKNIDLVKTHTLELNKELMLKIITNDLKAKVLTLNNAILEVEKNIKDKLNNITSLKKNISNTVERKNKQQKSIAKSSRIKSLNKEIKIKEVFVENKQEQIKNLNKNINIIELELKALNKLPYNELKTKYLNKYYNLKLEIDLNSFKRAMHEFKNRS